MYASLSGTRIYFGVEGMGSVIDNRGSGVSDEAPSPILHRITMIDECEPVIETESDFVNKRLVSGDKS